jgi:hypothetical protein
MTSDLSAAKYKQNNSAVLQANAFDLLERGE